MEYAAQYHIGHHPNAAKSETKKAVQAVGCVYGIDTTYKRRSRNKQGQTQVRSGANVANAFLKTTFLPKLEMAKPVRPPMEAERTEKDFYHSLSVIASHYDGLRPTDTKAFGYPYNVALSVWEVENHLRQNVRDWNSLRLVQDEKGKTFFICEEQYGTGATLYYIPVVPLYRMLRNKETKKVARLLLCVFAYLYHIADIPYYRQEDAYIYWQYEMITDWIEQDDEAESDSRKEELKVAKWCGDKVEQKIFNRKSLDVFAERLQSFKPKNGFEQECLKVAKAFYTLYTDYPLTTVFQHALCNDKDEEQEEVISMDKYISFIADANGWLYETLAESVNNELNEYSITEEPTVLKIFDGAKCTDSNLDFENRLFPLIGELCYLLNNH